MALSDVSQRCKAMSDLEATADIGRRYGLDGSVAFDPTATFAAMQRTKQKPRTMLGL